MPVYRCWMYFNQRKNGWKESFYLSGVTQVQALGQLANLAVARVKLLGSPAQCVRLLVVTEPGNRSYLDAVGPAAPAQGPAMSPHSALLVRLEAGPGGLYRRSLLLRGLPSEWVQQPPGEQLQRTSQATTALTAYLNAIVSGRFCLKVNDKTAIPFPIVDVQPSGLPDLDFRPTDFVMMTTAVPHNLTAGLTDGEANMATVAGVHWNPPQAPGFKVNGAWPILGTDQTRVILQANTPQSGNYLGGGLIQGRASQLVPIAAATPIRLVQKDSGRAFDFEGPASLPAIPSPARQPWEVFQQKATRPFPVYPGAVVISPGGQLNNALDMAAFVFSGYPSDVLSIAVARDLNHPGVWVIAIPGTNADTNANWPNAILNAFLYDNAFLNNLRRAISASIPTDSIIIMAGHSQGAMIAQNIVAELLDNGYVVSDVICYGSPLTIEPDPDVHYVFFCATYDPVPLLTTANPRSDLLKGAASLPLPNKTIVENNAGAFDFTAQHNCYNRTPFLTGFDAVGYKIGVERKPFKIQLGQITRYGVAPP